MSPAHLTRPACPQLPAITPRRAQSSDQPCHCAPTPPPQSNGPQGKGPQDKGWLSIIGKLAVSVKRAAPRSLPGGAPGTPPPHQRLDSTRQPLPDRGQDGGICRTAPQVDTTARSLYGCNRSHSARLRFAIQDAPTRRISSSVPVSTQAEIPPTHVTSRTRPINHTHPGPLQPYPATLGRLAPRTARPTTRLSHPVGHAHRAKPRR